MFFFQDLYIAMQSTKEKRIPLNIAEHAREFVHIKQYHEKENSNI